MRDLGSIITTLAPFAVSFTLTALLTPLVMVMARKYKFVAEPRADRWHQKPVALMGGFAIALGTMAGWLIFADFARLGITILLALSMFVLGLVDDLTNIRPHVKLIGQLTAGALLITGGVHFWQFPLWLALPVTWLWVVGVTNAINLLDNMDGLAAGVSMISALATSVYCLYAGAPETAPAALALAGGCAGFLLYNFSPAKIFMGDCGSLFLGFSLAALTVQCPSRSAPNLLLSLLVPVAVLAIPIFDTTLVSVARLFHGRSIAQGGRDHSSHRLVSLGLSERGTVMLLYGLTALFGALALLSASMPLMNMVLVMVLLCAGLGGLGLYLGFIKVYTEEYQIPTGIRVIGGTLFYKKQIFQVLLDNVLAQVAFVGAHLLRFEGNIPNDIMHAILRALPLVLMAKLFGLAFCRAYRGVWRYAGADDALRACAGSTLGTLTALCAISAITGFTCLSRAAFIIDWLAFSMLVVFARLGYVLLRHTFAMLPTRQGPRVVVLGAGTEGLALVDRLRDPLSEKRAHVLGVLDDDPDKHGRLLNGVLVLGPVEHLPQVIEKSDIACCLLGVHVQSQTAREILAFCKLKNIDLYLDLDVPLALHAASTN